MDNQKDKCVLCGKESPYNITTHIDLRIGYIEGGGQGCFQPKKCFDEQNEKLLKMLKNEKK